MIIEKKTDVGIDYIRSEEITALFTDSLNYTITLVLRNGKELTYLYGAYPEEIEKYTTDYKRILLSMKARS